MDKVLSIVIANYNFGRFLGAAIQSVVSQNCQSDVELIVVDGGSADESVNVIRKYQDQISWWCSERDGGQSEAFNKGFAHARGKYLTWLNADDVMPSGSLKKVVAALKAHSNCQWFTCNHLRFVESDKTVIQVEWGPHFYPRILQRKNSPLVVFGPATIFSKLILNQVGGVDNSFHFAMDTDLWIRFQSVGIKQRRISCFLWAFRMHEESKTAEFEGHRHVHHGTSPRLAAEHARACAKVEYHPSRILRLLALVFRVFDGSLIYRAFLRWWLLGRKYDIEKGSVV